MDHLRHGVFDVSENSNRLSGSPFVCDYTAIENRVDCFLAEEGVLPVNLHDYLKDLSVYQEKINLKSNQSNASSPPTHLCAHHGS